MSDIKTADLPMSDLFLTVGADDFPVDVVDLVDEVTVTVTFEHTPGCKGRMYLSNGDPGYPDEPDELVIHKVVSPVPVVYAADGITVNLHAGKCILRWLSKATIESLLGTLLRFTEEQAEDAKAQAQIDRAEERRELRGFL